jgi:hypothetical protein
MDSHAETDVTAATSIPEELGRVLHGVDEKPV